MGLTSVIAIFVTCILFNIFLPTMDVGTDIELMVQTVTFDLGDSLELEGCKSCYHKNEKEVYYPEKNLETNDCKICLYDQYSRCGRNAAVLKEMRKFQDENESCLNTVTFAVKMTFNHDSGLSGSTKFEFRECDLTQDDCCVTRTREAKKENPIQKLDRKKLIWPCYWDYNNNGPLGILNKFLEDRNEFDHCQVSGNANQLYCTREGFPKFVEQVKKRRLLIENSSKNETIFFYPYSLINGSAIMKDRNHSITDPNIECGILFFRHNGNYDEQRISATNSKYDHYCNEDVCLTHLKALHRGTSMTDLKKWRKGTEYFVGMKVGGLTCHILQIYGISMLFPIILTFCFNIELFVNDFRDQKASLFGIIPLIFFFYTQFKYIKILAQYLLIHRNESILNENKDEYDRTVANREAFLESCFQVHGH